MRAEKWQKGGLLSLLALPIIMKALEKGLTQAGKEYKNIDHMDEYS